MIAAEYLGMYLRILQTFTQTVGNHEVVDTPACILLTGLKTIRPP